MSSKLNLFKFGQKHKDVEKGERLSIDSSKHVDIDPNEELNFIDAGTDDPYSPDSDGNGSRTPSEASLIFERSVEDPSQVFQQTTCPRCGAKSNDMGILKCHHQSIVNLPSHYSVENFVSPCLDATTKIFTDDTADLDNVDIVYSRRPSSVMNLSMALNGGRTKSFIEDASLPQSPQQRTRSFASVKDLDSSQRPPILSFYSYADMINNEQPNPRRPSISQSLSSSFLNSRSNSMSSNSNKFHSGNAITPKRGSISQKNYHSPFNSVSQQRVPRSSNNFSLNPDNISPNSSDDESTTPYKPTSNRNSIASRLSIKKGISRTNSNQSSLISGTSSKQFLRSDFDEDEDEMVISSIGERLRRNTGEIKSN